MSKHRICPRIAAALKASGLAWSVDEGRRHMQIRVAGSVCLTMPYSANAGKSGGDRRALNALATVRRAIRAHGGVDAR